MERDEFKRVVVVIRSVYGTDRIISDKVQFDVWYELLKDLDFTTLEKATLEYCSTEHYPPTPAALRKKALMFMPHNGLSEAEAWELVRKALGKSTYNAKEEFEKLPKACQKAIGGYQTMQDIAMSDMDALSVFQSNFIKAYRTEVKREEEIARLPVQMQTLIENSSTKLIGENK